MRDTTKDQLTANVEEIARQLSESDFSDVYVEEGQKATVYDWLGEQLDIEYVVSSNARYLGARILCCCGGPTIWVETRTSTVRGTWGTTKVTRYFLDDDIDDALSEHWDSTR